MAGKKKPLDQGTMKVLKARVSAELHARVKVQAAINGESIEALLIEAIVHRLPAAQR